MADDTIRNIRISVSTETSQSQGNLARVLETLKQIQSLVNGISFPSKKITALASSLSKLNNVSIGKKFANSVEIIKKSMADLSSAVTDPQKTMAAAAFISSYAEIIKANAKTVENATSKERLAYQKRQSAIRNEINQEKLLNAQAKEARLSQPKVSGTRAVASQTFGSEQDASRRQAAVERVRAQFQKLREQADKEVAKTKEAADKLAARVSAKAAKYNEALAKKVEQENAKLQPVLDSFTPNTYKNIGAMVAMNSTFGRVANGAKTLASGMKKLTSTVLRLGIAAGKVAGVAGAGALGIAIAPFKSLARRVTDVTKRLGGFLSSVKRIAVYRAIRFVLKEITQAFKEGTDNLYQYSKAINGTFASSMDTLATSALYAKNSLAAMVSPLINAVAPAIDFIVDKFVDFINIVNQLIATLTGASTWTKALKYPKEYAEAADSANGKAKELRATLLGFDEINRLDDNSKGSRGSAADNLDYSKMFEEQEVSSKVKGIAQRIKDAFLEGDFYSIGNELGGKIRDALDDIPWESIQDRVKKNALSASSFINGIVDTEGLPEAIGDTLANAFNTVTLKIKTFFNDVKWKKVGEAVGKTLSTAVSKIDVQQLGEAVWSVLSAAVETALGMIETSPVIGTVALAGIGLKYGKLLGVNMGNGVANSGLSTTIQGLIPKVAAIAITAAVSFKIGNYLYNNVGWVQEIADNLVEWWNVFWGTEAYYATAGFYEQEKKLMDSFKAASIEWDNERKWLLEQGYSDLEAYNVLMAQDQLKTISWQHQINQALGLENSYMQDMFAQMKATSKLTEEEYDALVKLTIKKWEINFEIKFGKTPKEFIEEGIANIKSNLQKPIDNMKETGKELGTALKDTFLGIFNNDSLSNSIRERLKNSIPSKIAIDSVSSGLVSIRAYASGGDPVTGSMFIAGERGAELVSSTSSGTSVYNRDQISASVASGNEQTVAALNELIAIGQALLDKDMSVTTDSISNSLNRSNLRAGRTVVVTGG